MTRGHDTTPPSNRPQTPYHKRTPHTRTGLRHCASNTEHASRSASALSQPANATYSLTCTTAPASVLCSSLLANRALDPGQVKCPFRLPTSDYHYQPTGLVGRALCLGSTGRLPALLPHLLRGGPCPPASECFAFADTKQTSERKSIAPHRVETRLEVKALLLRTCIVPIANLGS